MKAHQTEPSELATIAAAVEVALFDPQPLVRMEAKAYLRSVDLDLLMAARQS